MKLFKILLTSLLVTLPFLAKAEIAEVYSWKVNPGEGEAMIASMVKAASIQRALGATVTINQMDVGSQNQIDYVLRVDDATTWGKFRDALQANPEWNEFWAEVGKNPSGTLETSFAAINLDTTEKASNFPNSGVYGVWVWDVAPGKLPEILGNFAKAKVIHEKLGARIEYYSEGLGLPNTLHYVAFFDDWSGMANFLNNASTSEELLSFQASTDPNSATLVRQLTGRTLPL
jgi:hypothetical protein